jgi:hypothetical protein
VARRPKLRRSVGAAGAAGLAALVLLGALAPAAGAYRLAGPRWPNKTIAVANQAPLYGPAVRRAVKAWNRARVGVRFAIVPRQRARVVFRYARGNGSGHLGCEGIAGGTGAGYPSPFVGLAVEVIRSCRSPALRLLTAAHELGHVLGLGHDDRGCALMNSTGNLRTLLPAQCLPGTAGARRLIRPDDVRGARALYRRAPPPVNQTVALFNPGDGSRLPWRPEPVAFAAAVRNPALEYRWDFGDPGSGAAGSARGLDATHAYASPGAYTITLTVLDGGTVIATSAQRIELF